MRLQKIIIILILIFSVLIIYRSDYRDGNDKANIWSTDEREFFKPVDIVWRGEIISTMAGGSCIGLSGNFDKYSLALACLSEGNLVDMWKFEGGVEIVGKWLGITCAYKNTVFGECVPEVSIEAIESDFK